MDSVAHILSFRIPPTTFKFMSVILLIDWLIYLFNKSLWSFNTVLGLKIQSEYNRKNGCSPSACSLVEVGG